MKAKWVRLAIGRKIDYWLKSITDESLRSQVKDNVIVTGGCIVSMLLGEPVNDFDIYLRDKSTALALAKYYVDKFKKNPPQSFKNDPEKLVAISVREDGERIKIVVKSSGIASVTGSNEYQYFEQAHGDEEQAEFVEAVASEVKAETERKPDGDKYRPVFLSANCITLSDKVQVIFRFFGEPEAIHSNYDFAHCTCYWDSKTRKLTLPSEALEAILARDLRYLGQSKYPICAMVRIRKFIKRGWNITAGQMLKIAWDINKLDLNSIAVLEDQLVGVDTAYFVQLIEMLRQKDPEKVDAAYLMEVIDKIF